MCKPRTTSRRRFASLAMAMALAHSACSSSQQQLADDVADQAQNADDEANASAAQGQGNDDQNAGNGQGQQANAGNGQGQQGNGGNNVGNNVGNNAGSNFANGQENATDFGDFAADDPKGGNGYAAASANSAGGDDLLADDGAESDGEALNAAPVDADIAEAVADPAVREDITEPAPAAAAPTPMAEAAPTPPPAAVAPPPPPPPPADLQPVAAGLLHWVGYKFNLKERTLRIEMATRGAPQYEIFQEQNRAQQPELVVRFLETSLRRKVRRDIDASEFRSPVAHVRMREDPANRHVDVVLTLRDPVRPKLFAKNGNVMLTYAIPPKYLGNLDGAEGELLGEAQAIAPGPIIPTIEAGSEAPKRMAVARVFAPNPAGQAFQEAPSDGGVPVEKVMTPPPQVDAAGLPASFGKEDDLVPADEAEPAIDVEGGEFEFDPGADAATWGAFVAEARPFTWMGVASAVDAPAAPNLSDVNRALRGLRLAQADMAAPKPGAAMEEVGADIPSVNGPNGAAVPFDAAPAMGGAAQAKGVPPPATGIAPGGGAAAADLDGQESESNEAPRQYGGRPLSIEFHKAPLSLVLQTFGEESGNNFIFKEDIGSRIVSLKFRNVPWDEALVGVLETHGLGMVKVGANVIRIDTVQNLKESLTDIKLAKQAEEESKPTKILVMRLNHADANEMKEPLQTMIAIQTRGTQVAGASIKVVADKRTNSIIAEAPPEYLARIKAIVERLDLETPQVEIASRIVEVARSSNNLFGIMWDSALNYDPGRALGFGTLPFPNSLRSRYAIDTGVDASALNAGFRFGSITNLINLDAFLSAQEKKGTTSILQSNKVIVTDRKDAMISKNLTVYTPTTTVQNGISITTDTPRVFRLELKVTPYISNDGYVSMKLAIVSQTPSPDGRSSSDRNVDTYMSRRSGETGVIGGIYDTSKSRSTVGVPWLSKLPIIGALFRSETTDEIQTELLVMITPTIMERSSRGKGGSEFKGFAAGDAVNAATAESNGEGNGNNAGNQADEGGNQANDAGDGNASAKGGGNANSQDAGNAGNAAGGNGDFGEASGGNAANGGGNAPSGGNSFDDTGAAANAGNAGEVM